MTKSIRVLILITNICIYMIEMVSFHLLPTFNKSNIPSYSTSNVYKNVQGFLNCAEVMGKEFVFD